MAQPTDLTFDKALMDFWIGGWEVSWLDSDSMIQKGENNVSKILNGQVVQENFIIETGKNKGFMGKSWSVFIPRTKTWKQTWVDNQGAYLDFVGELKEDSVIFKREFMLDSNTLRQQRMVFFNIQKNKFQWIWQHRDKTENQRSNNWIDDWLINYKRKE